MVIKKTEISKVIFYILFTLLLNCSCGSDTQITGGSTGTEVSAVAGIALSPDSTPAENAIVRLRTKDYLPDSAKSSAYFENRSIADTISDSDGFFKIENILPDTYYIEITKEESLSILFEMKVELGGQTYEISEKVLLSAAEIKGNIKIDKRDYNAGRIQVYGMEKVVYSDSSGYFYMHVPAGYHTFHFDAVLPDTAKPYITQKVQVNVEAGQSCDLGIINIIPFRPPPPHP